MSKNELKQIQSYIRRAYDIGKIGNMEAISGLSIELEKYLSDYVIVKIENVDALVQKYKDSFNEYDENYWNVEGEGMYNELNLIIDDLQQLKENS